MCQTELLFHATKLFEVKRWVRLRKRKEDITHSPSPVCQGARDDCQRLQLTQVQWWSCYSNNNWWDQNLQISSKVTAIEPRVAQVRHAAVVDNLTHQENAQYGANIVTSMEIKPISVCIVGPGTEKIPMTDQHKLTHRAREPWSKSKSKNRHRRYASEDSENRSRSRSAPKVSTA